MFPPSSTVYLDIEALSGICGSISIACWVVVFSPQIIENFRRKSADALSLLFLIIWLAGDVFNILGAVLQGVLPTMTILAVYYTLADIVLLLQCFYYRGFTWSESPQQKQETQENLPQTGEIPSEQQGSSNAAESSERTPLLNGESQNGHRIYDDHRPPDRRRPSQVSVSSLHEQFAHFDGTHLTPTMPLIEPPKKSVTDMLRPTSTAQIVAFNSFSVALVCAAGVLGWYISARFTPQHRHKEHSQPPEEDELEFNIWGQVFGYLCAVLYLGSRIPQLLLNWRRRSTEGVSLLFFLFACIGNLTYVLSIFAYSPICHGDKGACRPGEAQHIYVRYLLVNLSWLLGSLGTLALDMAIFAQFIMYSQNNGGDESEGDGIEGTGNGNTRGVA